MEGTTTRVPAGYIAVAQFSDLPPAIVQRSKSFVLDTLGVGIYGTSLPWCERLHATAEAMEAPDRAAVWCTPLKFSAPTAAMVNATAVQAFELDDIGPGGHSDPVTLGSALALAPHASQSGNPLTGAALINALVVGIETAARVNNCGGRVPNEALGFHGPGLYRTLGSVASAANALGLSADQTVHALGHAGQQAASLMFKHHGGMGKRSARGAGRAPARSQRCSRRTALTTRPMCSRLNTAGFARPILATSDRRSTISRKLRGD